MHDSELKAFTQKIQSGDRGYLARAITFAESSQSKHRQMAEDLLEALLPFTGKSMRIGVTGVPGVGKSTCIEQLGMHYIRNGKRVAVLAIDPSSNQSKGSILGDKTRMQTLSAESNAFIRPSPSSGMLGGLGRHTYESMLLCEAAGYEVILIETVGVGQSEVDVRQICDVFILLMLAGAGDEIQGMKKGIMEWVDILVVNKADGSQVQTAEAAAKLYEQSLHWFPQKPYGWTPQALTASSINASGIEALVNCINRFFNQVSATDGMQQIRSEQTKTHYIQLLKTEMLQYFWKRYHTDAANLNFNAKSGFNPYQQLKIQKKKWA